MHLVLSMSPVGEAFRRRCRMFTSLINCTTIDWYLPWPRQALLDVADRVLSTVEGLDEDAKKSISKLCCDVHMSVEAKSNKFWDELRRKFYVSPKSYLDLIEMYIKLLGEKRGELS